MLSKLFPLSYFTATTIINFIAAFSMGIFITVRGERTALSRTYIAFTIAMAFWSLFYTVYLITGDPIYLRTCMIGVSFVAPTFFHFVVILTRKTISNLFTIGNYVFAAISIPLMYTNYFAHTPENYMVFQNWLHVGPFFHLALAHFGGVMIYCFFVLYKSSFDSEGTYRNQLLWVFYAITIGFIGGVTNYFVWYRIPIPPFLNILVSFIIVGTAYAIVKYRLMDISLLFRNTIWYLIYITVISVIYIPLLLLLKHFSNKYFSWTFWPVVLIIMSTAPVIYERIAGRRRTAVAQKAINWIDKKLFRSKFDYIQSIRSFWQANQSIYLTSQLAWTLVPGLVRGMNLESASFYIYKRDNKEFIPIAQEGLDEIFDGDEGYIHKSMGVDDPLPMALKRSREIIVQDEVKHKAGEIGERIAGQMKSIGAYISVPFTFNRQLAAILNVGHKISGNMFNQLDFDLFNELVKTGESHLSHAMFLENSIFFSGNVAHDLRSPFKYGIMNEYLEDIAEGLKKQEAIPQAMEAFTKLENRLNMVHKMSEIMVNSYENVNRFVLGKFRPVLIDYKKLAKEIVESFKNKKGKDVSIELSVKTENPIVYAEKLDIERILSELITNAFKYTEKGSINVEVLRETDREVITCVADTGIGIPKEKIENIFEPFIRMKNDDGKGGIGVGLASIRQLLDANGGRIWVKSAEGRGTKIFFALPAGKEV